MMERRQIWLEDQFRQQERDLLKLSRQVYILQDFITLHFDSFRDYSIERGRADRPVHESGFKNLPFLRPPSPYSPYPERRMSVTSDLSESRDLDDPIDLSESDQGPPSPVTAVDLSSRTGGWTSHRCSRDSQIQSPSPSLSCSLSKDLVAENYKFEQLSPVSTDDVPPTESLSIFPTSSSSCANNTNSSINLSPRLPSTTESVLSRILRSDPATKISINYDTLPASVNNGSRKDPPVEYSPHLHWCSGTVTTTTPATVSAVYDDRDKTSDITENDSGTFKDNQPVEGYQTEFFNYISSGDLNSYAVNVNRERNPTVSRPRGRNGKHPKRGPRTSRGQHSPIKKPRGSNSSRTDTVTTPSPSETSREGQLNKPEGHRSKKCRFCGKTFQWSHSVKTHERLHTGDKPYLCKMCGTRFTQNGNLKVHAKTCVGKYAEMYKSKNILVCPLCTEMFQTVDALMEHQRSHDRMQWTDKDKTCRYCGQVFQKRSILLTHEMGHIQGDSEFHSPSSETGDNNTNVGSPDENTDE